MRNAFLATLLAVTIPGVSAADNHMTGIWQCKMVSEYGNFEFILQLSEDKTYTNKVNFFGKINIDYGQWSIDGQELVMNRERISENGAERPSEQEFRREIVSVSDSSMKLQHDDIPTSCSKAG